MSLNFLRSHFQSPTRLPVTSPRFGLVPSRPWRAVKCDVTCWADRSGRRTLGSKPHRQARLLTVSAFGTRLHLLSFCLVAMVMCEKRENSRCFFAEYCSRPFHFFPSPTNYPWFSEISVIIEILQENCLSFANSVSGDIENVSAEALTILLINNFMLFNIHWRFSRFFETTFQHSRDLKSFPLFSESGNKTRLFIYRAIKFVSLLNKHSPLYLQV